MSSSENQPILKTSEQAFQEHLQQCIYKYVDWKKAKGDDTDVFVLARSSIEFAAMALVINKYRHLNITEFTRDSYEVLRNAGEFKQKLPYRAYFGLNECLELLVPGVLSVDLRQQIKDLQTAGGSDAHKPGQKWQQAIEDVAQKLDNILDRVFEIIGKPKWKEERVAPILRKNIREMAELASIIITPEVINGLNSSQPKIIESAINEIFEKISLKQIEDQKRIEKIKLVNRRYRIKKISIFSISSLMFCWLIWNQFIEKKYLEQGVVTDYSERFNDTANGKYVVVLFPFQPLEDCKFQDTKIENTIVARLQELNESDSLNMQVSFDSSICKLTSTIADSIGRQRHANLVIWGDLYEHCFSENEACLKFINILSDEKDFLLPKSGQSGIEKMTSMSEVKNGKLQRDIDKIIYWIAGKRSMTRLNYSTALHQFSKLKNMVQLSDHLATEIGLCYTGLMMYDSAGAYFKMALDDNPKDVSRINNYAVILSYSNPYLSREYFETGLKLDSTNLNLQNNYAKLMHYNFHEFTIAKKHYEYSLAVDSAQASVQNDYATLLQNDLHDSVAALLHYGCATDLAPNIALYHYNYALSLGLFNKNTEAQKQYVQALILNPDSAKWHLYYSRFLYHNMADLTESKYQYHMAVTLDSSLNTYQNWPYY